MAEENKQKFELRKVYVKDMSFESPMTPDIFRAGTTRPTVDIQLNVGHNTLGDDLYESIVTVTVTGKVDDKDAFIVEVHQAGLYEIAGVEPDKGLVAALEVSCPNMLFPFAREVVNDLVTRGGFPQLLLAPVNFEYLYKQKVRSEQQAAQPAGDGDSSIDGAARQSDAGEPSS